MAADALILRVPVDPDPGVIAAMPDDELLEAIGHASDAWRNANEISNNLAAIRRRMYREAQARGITYTRIADAAGVTEGSISQQLKKPDG